MADRRASTRTAVAAVIVASALASCAHPDPTVGNDLNLRRFKLPEIAAGVDIGERFTMDADSLTAIDLQPAQLGTPRGTIHIDLSLIGEHGSIVVRRADVAAAELVRTPVYRMTFAPLQRTDGNVYLLEITSSDDAPSSGVTFWATKGEGESDDVLLFNGKQRWASLVFQTVESTEPLPPMRAAVWVAVALLVASWIGVALLVRELAA